MKTYILSVLGCVFLLDIVSVLLPSGKMGKTVSNVFRLCSVLMIVSPLFSIAEDLGADITSGDYLVETDSSYLNASLQMQIEAFVSENYGGDCIAEVKEGGVTLYLSCSVDEEALSAAVAALWGKEAEFTYGE